MSGRDNRKNKQRGIWYELESVKNDIISKESKGEDASYERKLLKSWTEYLGWNAAKQALRDCDNIK